MTTGRKPVSCEREARARAGMPGWSPRTTAWYSGSTASTAYAYRPADAAEPDAPRDLRPRRMRRAERRARRRGGAHDAVPPASRVSRPALDRGQVAFPFTPPELSGGTA